MLLHQFRSLAVVASRSMTMSGAGVMILRPSPMPGPAPGKYLQEDLAGVTMPRALLEEPFVLPPARCLLLAPHSPYAPALWHQESQCYGIAHQISELHGTTFHKANYENNTPIFRRLCLSYHSTKISKPLWKVIQIVTATRSPAEKEKRRRRRGALFIALH